MNFSAIKNYDIANGPGIRVSVFVSGCTHHCKNCFNPQTWNFKNGSLFTDDTMKDIITSLGNPYIRGLSILGGEPMEPINQYQVLEIIKRAKLEYRGKDIWLYSGFTYEEITEEILSYPHTEHTDEIMSLIDVLVDGPFKDELKNPSLKFRGSSNQRIIDMRRSRLACRPVLLDIKDRDKI